MAFQSDFSAHSSRTAVVKVNQLSLLRTVTFNTVDHNVLCVLCNADAFSFVMWTSPRTCFGSLFTVTRIDRTFDRLANDTQLSVVVRLAAQSLPRLCAFFVFNKMHNPKKPRLQ